MRSDVINILSNYVNKLLVIIFSLVATPYLLKGLGSYSFGVYGQAVVLLVLIASLDLGLAKSGVRFITLYLNKDKRNVVINSLLTLTLLSGTILSIVILIFKGLLFGHVRQHILFENKILSAIIITSFALIIKGFFVSLYYAYNRFNEYNSVNIIFEFLRWIAMILVVINFKSLIGCLWTYASVSLLHSLWLFFRVMKNIHVLKLIWCVPVKKGILRFSLRIFYSDIFNRISVNADKIVLMFLGTISGFGPYFIANQLTTRLNEIPANISVVYGTKFGLSVGQNSPKDVNDAYLQLLMITLLLLFPVLAILGIYQEELLVLWLGHGESRVVSNLFSIMLFGVIPAVVNVTVITLLTSEGNTNALIKVNQIGALSGVVIAYFLISKFDAYGAAYAWISIQVIQFFAYMFFLIRRFGFNSLKFNFSLLWVNSILIFLVLAVKSYYCFGGTLLFAITLLIQIIINLFYYRRYMKSHQLK